MKKKVLIIYHRVDFDGIFSALIAKKFYENNPNYLVDLFGYTYNDELPNFNLQKFKVDELVLVDISFPKDIMLGFIDRYGLEKVTWIDHHITAIRESENSGFDMFRGIRRVGRGACELCWEFFFDVTLSTLPQLIRDLSDYDVWYKRSIDYWNSVIIPLQLGIKSIYGTGIIAKMNTDLVTDNNFRDHAIEVGKPIYSYLTKKWGSYIKNSSIDITVGGYLKGIVLITPEFNSSMFESVRDRYQVFCIINPRRDNNTFSCSVYSEPDGRLGDFELGEYMKEHYQGGGHSTAAGGLLTTDQFINLITNRNL